MQVALPGPPSQIRLRYGSEGNVYRKNRLSKTLRSITELAGEDPVKGFVLKLAAIWRRLA